MCDRPEARFLQEAYNRLPNPEELYVIGACTNDTDLGLFWEFRRKMAFGFNISDQYSLGKLHGEFGINFVAINPERIYTSGLTNQAGVDEIEQFLLKSTSGVSPQTPVKSELSISNYPNPFNGSTVIKLNLDQKDKCEIAVYNTNGVLVAGILKETLLAQGSYTYNFQANQLPSGVYYVRIKTGNRFKFHKMSFIK